MPKKEMLSSVRWRIYPWSAFSTSAETDSIRLLRRWRILLILLCQSPITVLVHQGNATAASCNTDAIHFADSKAALCSDFCCTCCLSIKTAVPGFVWICAVYPPDIINVHKWGCDNYEDTKKWMLTYFTAVNKQKPYFSIYYFSGSASAFMWMCRSKHFRIRQSKVHEYLSKTASARQSYSF